MIIRDVVGVALNDPDVIVVADGVRASGEDLRPPSG
jgi:hypothetical protein